MSHPAALRTTTMPGGESSLAFRTARPQLWSLLLMIGAAFVLRLYHLDAQSFWSDEGISVIRARNDLPTLFATLPVEHVPLYFVGLHLWMQLTGEGDFAVRYFSLFFSVLAVPLVYLLGVVIGRSVFSESDPRRAAAARAIGLASALLAAINPLQVWYGQEARMYSLLVALCAGAAFCLLRASAPYLETPLAVANGMRSRLSAWVAFALLCTAALYTHFFAALVVAAFGIWSLAATFVSYLRVAHAGSVEPAVVRPRLWQPVIGSFALIGLLFSPWLPRAVAALSFPGWQVAADPLSLPGRYLVAYTLGTTAPDAWRWTALVFLGLLAIGSIMLARRRSMVAWLPLCYVFIPFTLLMLLALRKPGYHERYLIVITPFFFVILAVALYALRASRRPGRLTVGGPETGRALGLAAAAVVIALSGLCLYNLYFDASFAKPDFRAAAQYIDQLDRQGDGLIFDGPDPNKAFYRYFSRQKVAAFDGTNFDSEDAAESDAFLTTEAPKRDRWWVVLYFHPSGPTEEWLARFGYQVSSRWFNGIRVLLYSTPMDASLVTALPQSVETALPLQVAAVRTLAVVHAGEVLPVVFRWQPSGALPADYQASLRLLDGEGNRVQQIDRRPLDGRVPTSQWQPGTSVEDRYGLLVPASAGPGRYQIEMILYRLSGGDVLHALGPAVEVEP